MEGISKERLIELMSKWRNPSFEMLHCECTELNPWMPIESAPRNRQILGWTLSGYRSLIHWNTFINDWIDNNGDYVTPTHWQELPDDPK